MRRQNRPDQSPRPADRREMLSAKFVLVRRNVVVPIGILVRRRDARIVESQDFRGDERAVVAVGDGVNAEYGNENRDGVDRDHCDSYYSSLSNLMFRVFRN